MRSALKRFLFLLLSFLMASIVFAQKGTINIEGHVSHPKGNEVSVGYPLSPLSREFQSETVTIDEDGNFSIELELDKPRMGRIRQGRESTDIFLYPGESIFLDVNTDQFDESIRYKGSGISASASNFLAAFYLRYEDDKAREEMRYQMYEADMQSAKESFLTRMRDQQIYLQTWLKTRELADVFVSYMHNRIIYSNATDLLYLRSSRAYKMEVPMEKIELPDGYYNFLETIKLNNDEAIDIPEYMSFLGAYMHRIYKEKGDEKGSEELNIKSRLAGSLLKGEAKNLYLADLIRTNFQYGDFVQAEEMFKMYKEQKDPPYMEYLEPVYKKILPISPGKDAPNFTLMDKNGRKVSLKEFRGKVVYLDFWASWCGPCRREFPFSKKLQKTFEGEDVVFLYVSIDENKEDWLKAMKEEQLGGVHLFAKGFQHEVPASYGVEGIPAYFLIDRNGVIMNNNPDRPSGARVDGQIYAALKKEIKGKKK
ncbi:MAG: TlpA disulfide reductase family protein [Bacteroidota bacterium]